MRMDRCKRMYHAGFLYATRLSRSDTLCTRCQRNQRHSIDRHGELTDQTPHSHQYNHPAPAHTPTNSKNPPPTSTAIDPHQDSTKKPISRPLSLSTPTSTLHHTATLRSLEIRTYNADLRVAQRACMKRGCRGVGRLLCVNRVWLVIMRSRTWSRVRVVGPC